MNRNRLVILLSIALVMLSLAACKPVTSSEPTPAPLTDEHFNAVSEVFETTWTVQNFYGPDGPYSGIEGSYPSISIMAVRYEGYTGCNYYVGSYRVGGENNVEFDPPAVTMGKCGTEALHEQESNFMTVLVTTDEYAIDGDIITLYGQGKELMTLQPLEPVPFEGTTWRYSFYQGQNPQWQPALPDTVVTAVFDAGVISGSAGCNDYTGAYVMDGDAITISDLAATKKTCSEPADIMAQEERFLNTLQSATHIRVSARTVQLFNAERPIMLFSAKN